MCFRTTAPFLLSTSPLSLECRSRDLASSRSNLFSNLATSVIDVLPAVVGVKAPNAKGNCASTAASTGSRKASLICSRPHHLPLRHRIHRVDVIHPLVSVLVALMHRVHPQKSRAALRLALRRSPIDTGVGRVTWYWMRRSRYARLPRSRYRCATEIPAKFRYLVSLKL